METIRGLITEEYGRLDHPIQDFNNSNTTLRDDVLEMLEKAIVRQGTRTITDVTLFVFLGKLIPLVGATLLSCKWRR